MSTIQDELAKAAALKASLLAKVNADESNIITRLRGNLALAVGSGAVVGGILGFILGKL